MAPPDDDTSPPEPIEAADFSEVTDARARRGLLSRTGRGLSRVLRKARDAAGDVEMSTRPRALVRRLGERVRGALPTSASVARSLEALAHTLSDPRAVKQVHRLMSTLGQAGFEAAFRQEPYARLMFELAEWCGEQSSRGHVMAILMADATQPGGAVAQLTTTLFSGVAGEGGLPANPLAALMSEPPGERLDRALTTVQRSLMRTLCQLVTSATDAPEPDPDAALHELVATFRAADLPERFATIPDFVLGLDVADAPPPEEAGESPGALTTHRPATQLRRVVTAYLLFVETYLVRNMVDALPSVMERVREEMEGQAPPTVEELERPEDLEME